ncbi:MAG: cytochrome b [Thermodesulfovibrionales bacterium]
MDYIDERLGLISFIRSQFVDYKVPREINIFYTLGFVALTGFMIQAITGLFLLFYYIPHTDHAFGSVQRIMNDIPYGWLFRQVHVVGSNLMVAVVFLHLFSVFFMGSYKKPREFHWLVGAVMLFLVLTFCLSGYLLPWSQLSYWATTIVTNLPTAFPVIGEIVADTMRGGKSVTGITLNRFFGLHVALLPCLMSVLIALHIFLIRRTGISRPPWHERPEDIHYSGYRHANYPEGIPFYIFMIKEIYITFLYVSLIFFIIAFIPTLFLPGDALQTADPSKTPEHIRPEWYFLAPYQMLKLIPSKFLGISLQIILLLIFFFWPFIDRSAERNILKRPKLLTVFIVTTFLWIILTIMGGR